MRRLRILIPVYEMTVYFEPTRVRHDNTWKLSVALLVIFVSVDVFFVVVSGIRDIRALPKNEWHVSFDSGFGEQWQYVKWLAISAMCAIMSVRCRSAIHLIWTAIFLYLLIDDSLQLHEELGRHFAGMLSFKYAFGLRAQDYGELIVTLLAAVPLMGLLGVFYLREKKAKPRNFTLDMLTLLIALGVFGVGFDMLHIMIKWPVVRPILNLVEDGGEMVIASLMIAYVLLCYLRSSTFQSLALPKRS